MHLLRFYQMKRLGVRVLLGFAILAAVFAPGASCGGPGVLQSKNGAPPQARSVVVLVPDGCAQGVQTLARWYKGSPLAVDSIVTGTVRTWMADSVIADSAAAATAFASGVKTSDGFVGVAPREDTLLSTYNMPTGTRPYQPLATVLEACKLIGKSTGLVATSRVTHATPAAFAAHIHDRDLENEIMEQMIHQDLDIVLGGGKRHLLPKPEGKRTDGENLLEVLRNRGYQIVENREQMLRAGPGRIWGAFASGHMEADIDRAEFAQQQPSLAEMTRKAIEVLSRNPAGFFLLVEGSQVDWAHHANDPIYAVTDFLAFDDAVKIALDFAGKDGQTLVLAFADHNTGGLSIGNRKTEKSYVSVKVEDLVNPLKGMKISSTGLARKIGSDLSPGNVKGKILEWWGIDVKDAEVKEILSLKGAGQSLSYALCEVVCMNHTVLGWTSHGHTGEDVILHAYGPKRPVGNVDNTQLAEIVAEALGFRLQDVTGRLFVDVDSAFPDAYSIDTSDPANPVLVIGGAGLPVNKDLLVKGGKTYNLEGIVVQAAPLDRHKFYIPDQAVQCIRHRTCPE